MPFTKYAIGSDLAVELQNSVEIRHICFEWFKVMAYVGESLSIFQMINMKQPFAKSTRGSIWLV